MNYIRIALFAVAVGTATLARAGIIQFTDESLFQNQGTITFNSTFDSFAPNDIAFVSDPFVHAGVSYNGGIVLGSGSGYTQVYGIAPLNLFGDAFTGEFVGSFNMFGFNLSAHPLTDPANTALSLQLTTNLQVYQPITLNPPGSDTLPSFFGFSLTSATEHFTGFSFVPASQFDDFYVPANFPTLSNVQVGNATPAQAPDAGSSLLLLGFGFAFLGWIRRKRA